MCKYFVISAVLNVIIVLANSETRMDLYQECAKFYHPGNYMNYLPSLKLPFNGDVPIPVNVGLSGIGITGSGHPGVVGQPSSPGNVLTPGQVFAPGVKTPNNQAIQPSPVVKTKAIKLTTTYVYKNPVCVKYSKGKNMCKKDKNSGKVKEGYEQLVTKEYFVKDRNKDDELNQRKRKMFEEDLFDRVLETDSPESSNFNYLNIHVQSSETPRPFTKNIKKTPTLSKQKIQELLIEDRLDHLEAILPHYTRRRIYETSTITVTKVLSNQRNMATLIVRNCIPYGFELCESKSKNRSTRKSKVGKFSNNTSESSFYFG